MTPERWQAIKAVLETALERAGDQRAAFLEQACAGDDALRREVESLLESALKSGGFLEPPRPPDRVRLYPIERLNAAFAGRYRIQRELGGGGMSRVFLAEERPVGRHVVVKVLVPSPIQLAGAARFHREIRIAARLTHPNIVPVLASGELDGFVYYTMPFVDGESLKARLEREGRVERPEAVRILLDVTAALVYAHGRGIVHRDVKPANILLERGRALVLDFGIATAPVTTGESEAVRLTADGMIVGTPAYMAPERVTGDAAADHRADLYSLGVVAYEMLHGELPGFAGAPAADLLGRSPLDELIDQLLQRRPPDRPGSAEELQRRLQALS